MIAMEHRLDAWMVLAAAAILGTSLVILHAVGPVIGEQMFFRQLIFGSAGLALLLLLSRFHITVYERLAPILYVLSLVALVAVLLLGQTRAGTRAWFVLGPVTVQPSEIARLATALMVASWLARRGGRTLSFKECAAVVAIVAAPMALILLEPDLGVALTYTPLIVAAFWLGGLPVRVWVSLALLAVLVSGFAWNFALRPYQKERVLTLLDQERDPYGAGYQVRQSKIAVGSGRVVGQGLGRGSQSLLRFLPAQHTDFVFAAWAEATGFVGATGLLLAYALLLSRIGLVAATADSRHGLILSVLLGSWLAFQVIVNLGMVLGWLPTTGITLPLFSYGGSSLLSCCAALGVVQAVWRFRLVNQ
jgi:rod shape determining protein RodA